MRTHILLFSVLHSFLLQPCADANTHGALVDLYDSTRGPKWSNNTGWLGDRSDHCNWHGVSCSSDGHVLMLDLKSNGLVGTIPPGLSALILSDKISGKETKIHLQANRLSGTIPVQLWRLSLLQHLRCEQNSLSGTLADGLWSLTSLMDLQLFQNNISGTVSMGISQLTATHGLGLFSNALSGTVSQQLQALAQQDNQLYSLQLSNNPISGTVMQALTGLSNLHLLQLYVTSISGTVAKEIPTSIAHLQFYRSLISGTIVEELSKLTGLLTLQFYKTPMSGTLSAGTFTRNWTNVFQIIGFSTSVSGSVPESLAKLPSLKYLYLQRARFSGTMPSLASSPVTFLGLFGNKFSGQLVLPHHASLRSVVVQNNRFSCRLDANYTGQANGISYSSLLLPGQYPHSIPQLVMAFVA